MADRGFLRLRSARTGGCWALTMLAAFFAAGILCAQTSESPLSRLQPDPSRLDGWLIKDEFQAYEGGKLFLYIDGGAEIYREYGFARVLVQDYWKGERSISLEIFEMTSSDAAFGIFSFKRSKKGRVLGVGSADGLEEYYMNFWKGRFLVTLTGMNSDEETIEGIQSFARGVAEKIEESADRPSLLKALPLEGLIDSSLKYMKGQLGLYNIYPFFEGNPFGLKEAVKGDYTSGTGAFVFRYDSSKEAVERYAAVGKAFQDRAKYQNFSKEREAFRVNDNSGLAFRVGLQGRFILMISGAGSLKAETEAFKQLSESLSASGL